MEEKKEIMTDEQLWQLCLEEEKKKKILQSLDKKYVSHYTDKCIDYEYWGLIYERNKNLK